MVGPPRLIMSQTPPSTTIAACLAELRGQACTAYCGTRRSGQALLLPGGQTCHLLPHGTYGGTILD